LKFFTDFIRDLIIFLTGKGRKRFLTESKSVLKESTIERNTYNDSIPAGTSQNHSKMTEKAPLEKRVKRVDEKIII